MECSMKYTKEYTVDYHIDEGQLMYIPDDKGILYGMFHEVH
jgi:hypothetical protein